MGYSDSKEHCRPWRYMGHGLLPHCHTGPTLSLAECWHKSHTDSATYEVDMQSEFALYFKSTGLSPDRITKHGFELMAGSWLSAVTRLEETTGELATNVVG